jgi:O-antigen/teichoic acid export membrane protein
VFRLNLVSMPDFDPQAGADASRSAAVLQQAMNHDRSRELDDRRSTGGETPTFGRIAGAVMSNWVAVAAAMAIAFFLPPFVVRHLGDAAYGVWVLIGSTVAYMAFLDLGLRGGVVHFLASSHAIGDHAEASRVTCAAVALRVLIAGIVLLASCVLALFLDRIFAIPSSIAEVAPRVLILVGASLSVTLVTSLFGAVLAALHRFDLLSAITVLRTGAIAASTFLLLRSGYGIEALAWSQLVVNLACGVLMLVAAHKVYPELEIWLHWPEKRLFLKLWSYSFYLSLISISAQVVYYSDNVVVGFFLSAAAVTFFAIAGGLISYQQQLAAALAQTMMPLASNFGARGEYDRLRNLLIQGSRAAILVSWPIQIVLFIRGETFLSLWMGPKYAVISGRIMRILLASAFLHATNEVSGNVSFGLGKHKPYALWQCVEAVVNLVLSIVLAQRMGLEGVAWGTTIPSIFTQAVLWPIYVCRMLNMQWSFYMWQVWIRPALALIPFATACVYVERNWRSSNLLTFFGQVVAICPLIVVGLMITFRKEIREQIPKPGTLLNRAANRLRFAKLLNFSAAHE